MSSVTTRLHFATMVYILPLRNPLELAKTLGTLALLSGGRVVLGAGAGWIREEYDTLGIPFETRGKRMEEMIDGDAARRGRAAWSSTAAASSSTARSR